MSIWLYFDCIMISLVVLKLCYDFINDCSFAYDCLMMFLWPYVLMHLWLSYDFIMVVFIFLWLYFWWFLNCSYDCLTFYCIFALIWTAPKQQHTLWSTKNQEKNVSDFILVAEYAIGNWFLNALYHVYSLRF